MHEFKLILNPGFRGYQFLFGDNISNNVLILVVGLGILSGYVITLELLVPWKI